MRDLQDKFLVRAWLVDPTAKIIPHTGVCTQVISLDDLNLVEVSSLASAAAGRIPDANGEGLTPNRLRVHWPPRPWRIVIGGRGGLLVRRDA